MNPASEERFLELALKLVARECSAAEKAELRRLLEEEPARKAHLTKLCTSAGIARELLPLVDALEATEGEMTGAELARLQAHVARVRRPRRRQEGPRAQDGPASHQGSAPDDGRYETFIDAEVVPERKVNVYKILFYVLLLSVLVIGTILLLRSCRPSPGGVGAPATPANQPAAQPASVVAIPATNPPAPTAAVTPTASPEPKSPAKTPIPETSPPPQPVTVRPAANPEPKPEAQVPVPESKPTPQPVATKQDERTLLPNYESARWEKIHDEGSKPGFRLNFQKFAVPWTETPVVVGKVGRNRGSVRDLLLATLTGPALNMLTFPSLPSSADLATTLESGRQVVSFTSGDQKVFLIDRGQAKQLPLSKFYWCSAIHPVSAEQFFLHDRNGRVSEFRNGKVAPLAETDAANYIHQDGKPTTKRRGWIRNIGLSDSGQAMGIYYVGPGRVGTAALVRFDGKVWELVCSLDNNFPTLPPHYLSADSMAAIYEDEVLLVKGATLGTPGATPEFKTGSFSKLMAIRTTSADEFILVANNGCVLRYLNGRYRREVEPLSGLDESESVYDWGFQSVMIAPSGVIYAIYSPSRLGRSSVYRLSPQ